MCRRLIMLLVLSPLLLSCTRLNQQLPADRDKTSAQRSLASVAAGPAERPCCDPRRCPEPLPPSCDGGIEEEENGPTGALTAVNRRPGGVVVQGWAQDLDTDAPIRVRVFLRPGPIQLGEIVADAPHPAGNHGFDAFVSTSQHGSEVCVVAINVGVGSNTGLGCRPFTANPIGWIDIFGRGPGLFNVSGWALDPDTADPIAVHAYIDGNFAKETIANVPRPDVGAAHPDYGDNHGFGLELWLPPGSTANSMCVYAINVGAGTANPMLGCNARPTAPTTRPVYIIAHRCNGTDWVPTVVRNQGVNAVEADFSYGRPLGVGDPRWVVDHDGVYPWSTNLDLWLDRVAAADSALSLVILDIKNPSGRLDNLYDRVRAKLPDLNLIFSIGNYEEGAEFLKIKDKINADVRAAVAIDYEAAPEDVQAFFSDNGFLNFWYGDGVFAAGTSSRIERNVTAALGLRGEQCDTIRGVYTWTYEKESSIKRFLDMGVDGIFVNASECHGFASPINTWEPSEAVEYASNLEGRRYATRSDNLFRPHCGAVPR